MYGRIQVYFWEERIIGPRENMYYSVNSKAQLKRILGWSGIHVLAVFAVLVFLSKVLGETPTRGEALSEFMQFIQH